MKRQRFFALFFAILFLVTSSSLAIAFIWASVESKNNAGSNTSKVSNSAKLQGTELKGFTPVSSVSSLQITDLKVGSGAEVKAGDNVVVDYTGAVAATGIIFQSSLDAGQTASLSLNQVIAGWAQGIPGMKDGGERQLLIPANLAYGANPPAGSGIPANAPLVFDVTLHSFTSG
jgi:FKBP-type peptidyl-prolyl cis-trans isomerase